MSGGERFEYIPALKDSEMHGQFLTSIIEQKLSGQADFRMLSGLRLSASSPTIDAWIYSEYFKSRRLTTCPMFQPVTNVRDCMAIPFISRCMSAER